MMTAKEKFVFAIAFLGVFAAVQYGIFPWAFIFIPALALAAYVLPRQMVAMRAARRANALQSAIADLDAVSDGKRWLGAQTTIVLWGNEFHAGVGEDMTRELLCRTHSGAWFVVTAVVSGAQVKSLHIAAASDEAAAKILEPECELYLRYFPSPPSA